LLLVLASWPVQILKIGFGAALLLAFASAGIERRNYPQN
jgi:hypothetical protein